MASLASTLPFLGSRLAPAAQARVRRHKANDSLLVQKLPQLLTRAIDIRLFTLLPYLLEIQRLHHQKEKNKKILSI